MSKYKSLDQPLQDLPLETLGNILNIRDSTHLIYQLKINNCAFFSIENVRRFWIWKKGEKLRESMSGNVQNAE